MKELKANSYAPDTRRVRCRCKECVTLINQYNLSKSNFCHAHQKRIVDIITFPSRFPNIEDAVVREYTKLYLDRSKSLDYRVDKNELGW